MMMGMLRGVDLSLSLFLSFFLALSCFLLLSYPIFMVADLSLLAWDLAFYFIRSDCLGLHLRLIPLVSTTTATTTTTLGHPLLFSLSLVVVFSLLVGISRVCNNTCYYIGDEAFSDGFRGAKGVGGNTWVGTYIKLMGWTVS